MNENRIRKIWVPSIEAAAQQLRDMLRDNHLLGLNIMQGPGSVDGPGKAYDSVIAGSVHLGKGSKLVACSIGLNSKLVVGDNTVVACCRIRPGMSMYVGNDSVVWEMESNDTWNSGADRQVKIGNNCIMLNVDIITAYRTCSIYIEDGARMYYGNLHVDNCVSPSKLDGGWTCSIGSGLVFVYMKLYIRKKGAGGCRIGSNCTLCSDMEDNTLVISPSCTPAYAFSGPKCGYLTLSAGKCVIGDRFTVICGLSKVNMAGTKLLLGNDVTVYAAASNMAVNYKSIEIGNDVTLSSDSRLFLESGNQRSGRPLDTYKQEQRKCTLSIGNGASVVFSFQDAWTAERGRLFSSNIYVPAGERYVIY